MRSDFDWLSRIAARSQSSSSSSSSSEPDPLLPEPLLPEPEPLLVEPDESSSSVVGGDELFSEPEPLLPEPDESSSSSSVVGGGDEPLLGDVPPDGIVATGWSSSSSSSTVPFDGVVLRGRVVACPGALLFEGVVDCVSDSAIVSRAALVESTVVVDVDVDVDVVLVADVDGAGDVDTGADCPGFCQTDRVMASPTVGNRASRSASAEPAEPNARQARMSVPVVRRSFREKRGPVAAAPGERSGRA